MNISTANVSINGNIYVKHYYCHQIENPTLAFNWHQLAYLNLTLAHSKGKGLEYHNCKYLSNDKQIWQTLLLPSNRKSHISFRLPYQYLTVADFKGQGQRPAYFSYNCLTNGNR